VRRAAFTLVEAVFVMAVMAVLAAIAAPRYAAATNNYRAMLAARRLAADVIAGQAAARSASASRTLTLVPSSNSYSISVVGGLDPGNATYSVSLSASPYYAAFGAISFTDHLNDNTLVFDGYGTPDSGATIAVVSGGVTRTVTIDASTGAVSVQ
jgi:type II secretory pathway pseudopilin PulG